MAQARASHAVGGGWLGDHLLALGSLTPQRMAEAVSVQLGLPLADEGDVVSASRMLARLVSLDYVSRWRVVPFAFSPHGGLCIALYEPASAALHAPLQAAVGGRVDLYAASEPAVEAAIARLYPSATRRPSTPPAPALPSASPHALGPSRTPRAITMPAVLMPAVGSMATLNQPPPARTPVWQVAPRSVTMPVMPAHGANLNLRLIPRAVTIPQIPVTTIRPGFRRIADVGQAAEELFTAENVRTMADVMVAFVCNFFPRVLVMDATTHPTTVLASHGVQKAGPVRVELPRGVERPYYGMVLDGPAWQLFTALLGEPAPAVMMVMPVFKGDVMRLVLYADSPANELYEDLREVDMLVRELRTAMQVLNL
jgi:hypothetical protein